MIIDVDAGLVSAALHGDPAATEELVAACLPLVYNIAGRALAPELDVEDNVQETMLHAVHRLPELHDPSAFRAWLVAISVEQVRTQHGHRKPELWPRESFDAVTVRELKLTGQRMEIARAAAWLDDADRELLSLWWLSQAGELSRGEMIAALGLGQHGVAMHIERMKAQLDTARSVVRAVSATYPCPQLTGVTSVWPGYPSSLWRERIARHMRECHHCLDTAADLVPAGRLLASLPLVPVPVGLAAAVNSRLRLFAGGPTSHRRPVRWAALSALGRRGAWVGKVAGVVGAAAAVGGAVAFASAGSDRSTELATSHPYTSPQPTPVSTGSSAATPAQAVTAETTDSTRSSPSARASSAHATTPTKKATPHSSSSSSSPAAAKTSTSPPPSSSSPSPNPAGAASAEDQVLAVINQARAGQGLPALTRTSGLNQSAAAHNQVMSSGGGFSHQCPGEPDLGVREHNAGVSWGMAAENIALGGPVPDKPDSIATMATNLTWGMLAEKPPNDGHRANILDPGLKHIGIAVVRGSNGNVWLTQDFSD